MAKNLKQLPSGSPLQSTDLMYVVRPADSDTTADKQIPLSDVISYGRAYGQIYLTLGANPTQSVTATPTAITAYDTEGISVGMTLSAAAGTITVDPSTISNVAWVGFSLSGSYSANATISIAIYKNSIVTGLAGIIDLTNNNIDAGNLSVSGIGTYSPNDVYEVRIWASAAGTFTFNSLMLGIGSI